MKYFLIILFLFPSTAFAATFVSAEKVIDQWAFQFNIQSGPQEKSTPLNVSIGDCNGPINHRTNQPILPKSEICAHTEEEARIMAQKDADTFEQNLIKTGQSTTKIEAARRKQ